MTYDRKKVREEYRKLFSQMADEELIESFNNDACKQGWVSARGFLLSAIHHEFEKRGFDYSVLEDRNRLSLGHRVKLTGKKMEIIDDCK